MSIENRNLSVGTILTATYRKQVYTCEVIPSADGNKTLYRFNGKEYTSPSGAGSAARGGKSTNGWDFWSVKAEQPATTAPEPTPQATKAKPDRSRLGEADPQAAQSGWRRQLAPARFQSEHGSFLRKRRARIQRVLHL